MFRIKRYVCFTKRKSNSMRVVHHHHTVGLLIALLILPFTQLSAQQKANSVKGKINLDSNYVVLISPLLANPENDESTQELPIAQDGSFAWKNEDQFSSWYQVMFMPKARNKQLGATFPLFLSPKAKEELQLSYNDTSYIHSLSKKTSAENSALINYAGFINQRIRESFVNPPKKEDVPAFLNSYLEKAQQLASTQNLKNKEVKDYLKLWSYNSYLSALFSMDRAGEIKTLPADLLATMDSEQIFMFYNGVGNLNQLIDSRLKSKGIAKRDKVYLPSKIALIKETFNNEKLVDGLIKSDLASYVSSYRLTSQEQFAKDIEDLKQHLAHINDKKAAERMLRAFANLRYTAIGSEMPNIKFKDAQGQEVSLQAFKGKYIYIDLWASWCVPCIKEVPYLKELEKTFAEKNIAFVSISLDENKEAWKNKMKELDLHGAQWELGDSSFDKLMNVRGIPHFILYGPDGKLIYYQAPRPSSAEIKEIFKNI